MVRPPSPARRIGPAGRRPPRRNACSGSSPWCPTSSAARRSRLADTATAFGLSERQLLDDLNLLWCVELRNPDPYCPIDLSYEGGEIVVSQAESMGRPLRLAVDEASALLVALRMLADIPGLEDRSALSRLIAKLEAAAGEAAGPSAQVAVQVDKPTGDQAIVQIRDALERKRRVHLRYYVPGRDEATQRDVDPMRLLVVEGRAYLEGWCRRAEGVRLFRLDRILGIDVLDVPAAVPEDAQPVDVDQGLFRPSADDVHVTIEVFAAGRWVAEYSRASRPRNSATAGSASGCAPRTPAGSAAGAAAGGGRPGHRAGRPPGADPGGRGGRAGRLRLRLRAPYQDAGAASPDRPSGRWLRPVGSVTECDRPRFHRKRHLIEVDTAQTGTPSTRRYRRYRRLPALSCHRSSPSASAP